MVRILRVVLLEVILRINTFIEKMLTVYTLWPAFWKLDSCILFTTEMDNCCVTSMVKLVFLFAFSLTFARRANSCLPGKAL